MSYFVVCTFDLKNASAEDYRNAYSGLAKLGLSREVTGASGTSTLPTTTWAGSFRGESAQSVSGALSETVTKAFAARGLVSTVFVIAADGYSWTYKAT